MRKPALLAIPVLLVATAAAGSTLFRMHENLAQQRAEIATEWSDVVAAMTERASLAADLAGAAEKHAPVAAELAKQIEDCRAAIAAGSTPQEQMQANDRLSNAMAKLLVEAENYPRLRSSRDFLRAQEEIRKSDDRIAVARLKYNDTLEHYNARIQSFPDNLVAKISGFRRNDAYFPTEHF